MYIWRTHLAYSKLHIRRLLSYNLLYIPYCSYSVNISCSTPISSLWRRNNYELLEGYSLQTWPLTSEWVTQLLKLFCLIQRWNILDLVSGFLKAYVVIPVKLILCSYTNDNFSVKNTLFVGRDFLQKWNITFTERSRKSGEC